jgi:hypothetical protein
MGLIKYHGDHMWRNVEVKYNSAVDFSVVNGQNKK